MCVVGYTTEMDSWMAAADLLVGRQAVSPAPRRWRAASSWSSLNPIPGQEERNSDHS